MKIELIYQPIYTEDSPPLSTNFAETWERNLLWAYNSGRASIFIRTYCNSLPFTIVRALIAEGKIDYKDVTFIYNDEYFNPNEFGAIHDYPDSMDVESNYCERVLRGAVAKRKSKKG